MGRIHMYFGTDFWLTSRTSCSVTGLKVSKGLSKKKEVSTWAGATVWGKQFLNVRILSMKNSERKNVRESNRVKAGGKKRTFDLSKNISEVAKQFFRWLASLNLGRVEGCFGVVNKFSNFAFCIFICIFAVHRTLHHWVASLKVART